MLRNALRLSSRSIRTGALATTAGVGTTYMVSTVEENQFAAVPKSLVMKHAACAEAGVSSSSFDVNRVQDMLKSQYEKLKTMDKPDWLGMDTMQPLGGGLGFGGITGFAAGVACKKIGKIVAVGVGSLYCLFQTAAYYDYIKINWKKVEADTMRVLDTDGNGTIDEKDMGVYFSEIVRVLAADQQDGQAAKNAATGGFAAMFLYGLKKG